MAETERVTFTDCVWECWGNAAFMREYRRLSGHTLGLDARSPIEKLIDGATGHEPTLSEVEARQFLDFVRDHVWLTFPG